MGAAVGGIGSVGRIVGAPVGSSVDAPVGAPVGSTVAAPVGVTVGAPVGASVGASVGVGGGGSVGGGGGGVLVLRASATSADACSPRGSTALAAIASWESGRPCPSRRRMPSPHSCAGRLDPAALPVRVPERGKTYRANAKRDECQNKNTPTGHEQESGKRYRGAMRSLQRGQAERDACGKRLVPTNCIVRFKVGLDGDAGMMGRHSPRNSVRAL